MIVTTVLVKAWCADAGASPATERKVAEVTHEECPHSWPAAEPSTGVAEFLQGYRSWVPGLRFPFGVAPLRQPPNAHEGTRGVPLDRH